MKSDFSREKLVALLNAFNPERDRADVRDRVVTFVRETPTCAERSHRAGHLTGSAWVVNTARTKVLLLHHRKLDRWMQPGGHADGELNLLEVALREAREESGLTSIEPVSSEVFDIDIHEIPEYRDIPAHYHYDVRFLFVADDAEVPQQNEESNGVAWVSLGEIRSYTEEESVLRMARMSYSALRR